MTRKRGPVRARCYVLRADAAGQSWYIGRARSSGKFACVTDPRLAVEYATLADARLARCEAIWPCWRVWRRGKR